MYIRYIIKYIGIGSDQKLSKSWELVFEMNIHDTKILHYWDIFLNSIFFEIKLAFSFFTHTKFQIHAFQ